MVADWISIADGEDMGAADPDIYADANSSNYSTDFHDITSGNNGAFSAAPGWDHPTGWGSINAVELLTHIGAGVALAPPVDLKREYVGCPAHSDIYDVSWKPGPVGVPTEYDLEVEIAQGGWDSVYEGSLKSQSVNLPPNSNVGIRVRATSGNFWTAYDTISLTTSPCSPPPGPVG